MKSNWKGAERLKMSLVVIGRWAQSCWRGWIGGLRITMQYHGNGQNTSSSTNNATAACKLPHAARAIYLACCLLALNNAYITFSPQHSYNNPQ
jgi:hypothetical protein